MQRGRRCDQGRGDSSLRPILTSLAPRTEISEASLVSLGMDLNRRPAAWTGSSAPAMDRMALSGDRRYEVAAHQVAGPQVKLAQALVIQLRRTHPGIEAKSPERFALVDVANTRTHALLQQQLAEGGCFRDASAADDLVEVERIDQDIRSQVRHRLPGITDQLHDGRGKADGDDIIETQHRGGAPLRLAPALTDAVEVPGAGHPHVRMKGESTLELHHEVFAVRLD